jgi:hypothetical protein
MSSAISVQLSPAGLQNFCRPFLRMVVVDGPGRVDACIERGLSREYQAGLISLRKSAKSASKNLWFLCVLCGWIIPGSFYPDNTKRAVTILLSAKKIKFFYSFFCKHLAILGSGKIANFRTKRAVSPKGGGT